MSEDISKRVCCTCLCEDRKLFLLCREPNGINLIYMLLMCDSDAYREGFFKDTASWMVCWECRAVVKKIMLFRSQTCQALKRLKDYADGRINQTELQSLSSLETYHHTSTTIETSIFVDCNLDTNKQKNEIDYNNDSIDEIDATLDKIDTEIIKKNKKTKTNYRVTTMNATQFKAEINKRRLEIKDVFKCESCVLGFKDESSLSLHMLEFHTKKENHSLCVICMSYIADAILDSHTNAHYKSYACVLCDCTMYTLDDILKHLESHGKTVGKRKKRSRKSADPVKYSCSECDMTFENKGAKWKHVQKCHRAGHKCDTCQKVFTFKHNLQRHQLTHTGPHPRSACPHCGKRVRTALLAAHARTHAARARVACEPCGKAFVCRATYENHLKYASAHASRDSLKHECTSCEKKFRSRGELRDHVAYVHEARPTYKCPVCDKPLATRRCVTRHVRRAHDGIQERARDKMCDYCGLAFRDKQSLAEHVWRHTGARPLTCARCGRAFRQRAALHAHARRLHPRT